MIDVPTLVLAFLGGIVLGVFFFGGLWWTVRRGLESSSPALWFFASLLIRTGVILGGFYWLAQRHWSNLIACLVGFLIARLIVVRRFAGSAAQVGTEVTEESNHAP